jgi:hypothetical protein
MKYNTYIRECEIQKIETNSGLKVNFVYGTACCDPRAPIPGFPIGRPEDLVIHIAGKAILPRKFPGRD